MENPNPFIEAARVGRNAWWRYLITVIYTLLAWMAAYGVARMVATYIASGRINQQLSLPAGLSPAVVLVVDLASYVGLILGLFYALNWLHRRSPWTLICPVKPFRWGLLAASGGLWLVISGLGDGALNLIFPGSYHFSFNPAQFWPYALAAALTFPVQVAGEEFFFRGYLTQGLGLAGGTVLGWLGPALLFGLLHYSNPEVGTYGWQYTMPVYIGMGLLLGWITLRSAGLEMALGLHLANNLYASLLVTVPDTVLPSQALFRVVPYHPAAAVVVNLATLLVYVGAVVLLGKMGKRGRM